MNRKTVNKMLIAVELLVGPLVKQHSKKHIMFLFKVAAVGSNHFTEIKQNTEGKG